ncbi:MAG: hypothetical protein WC701_01640 [Kiritimatiellales bacterium]|jgi:Skp family chaperone for outer membrane proteins
MSWLRCTLSLSLAALIGSAVAVRAEENPKLNIPEVKVDSKVQKDAEKKMHAAKKEAAGITNAVKKDAESKIKHAKKHSAEMQNEQMKKTEELKKEADKGSEKGQAMREEHSKKWWKFGGDKEPATPAPAK